MNATSLNPELVTALKRLRLGGMLPTLPERLTLADQQGVPFQDVLLMLSAPVRKSRRLPESAEERR